MADPELRFKDFHMVTYRHHPELQAAAVLALYTVFRLAGNFIGGYPFSKVLYG